MFGITFLPINHFLAPVTGKATRSYLVIERGAMDEYTPTAHCKRMVRHFLLSVALWVDNPNGIASRASALYALIMEIAEAVFSMGALAAFYLAVFLVDVVVYVAMMLLSPIVHLTKTADIIGFITSLNSAVFVWQFALLVMCFICTPNAAKLRRIVVISPNYGGFSTALADDSCSLMVALYIRHCVSPLFNYTINVAEKPKFYGATYCIGCQKHLPVEEFVWSVDGEVVGS